MYKFLTATSLILIAQISFAAVWELNNNQSTIYFESTKNKDIKEQSKFDHLSGSIDDKTATAKIDVSLNSVDTRLPIRDERIREILFETTRYPLAVFNAQFASKDSSLLDDMQAHKIPLTGTLNLHGVTHEIVTHVLVQKIDANTLQIKNAEPVVLDTNDYNLQVGVAALQKLAGLESIDPQVPLSFTLIFDKK